jgi:triacylglycerol lipase
VLDPSGAEILHQLLPNSRISIMPNTGHLPMLEAPERSAENYLRFRDSLVSETAKTP